MVGILARVLSGGGIRRPRLVKPLAGAPRLEPAELSRTTAFPGDVVRISAKALDAGGLFMSPFGDPSALIFDRAAPHPTTSPGGDRCIPKTVTNIIVWAEYKVRADLAFEGTVRMSIALFENAGTECNGDGARADQVDAFLEVRTKRPPPPPEEPPPPPPPEEPVPLICRIPILKQLFCQ